MLPLSSAKWTELKDAYGSASRIPELLRELGCFPAEGGKSEPWFSLWSALAHQGDVYPASFAAVPHVIEALGSNPQSATPSYFQFPAWVEICRQKSGTVIPQDLSDAYFASLARLPVLLGAAATRDWDNELLRCALAAVAASQGQCDTAEAILELSPEVSAKFLDWFYEQ